MDLLDELPPAVSAKKPPVLAERRPARTADPSGTASSTAPGAPGTVPAAGDVQ
ncbi:hypothetical protein JHN59_31915 [Streptomyces sp. MBT49]|uniref:hypothetical protein n=1 Tax=Streptomyces sp. MBT49 TaxID=1488380 RepID=UPI001909D4DB|nr:hypothetical protein [Streptomyces sp. MBT49]MBK3629344.1 hypothetical protein [Streptomyces sp. MBT49]